MKTLNALDWTAIILLVIGGINWGLIGIFDWNLVAAIFGEMTVITRIVYDLVGISAVYLAFAAPAYSKKTTTVRSA